MIVLIILTQRKKQKYIAANVANIVTVNNYYNNSNKVTVPVDNKTVTLLDIINIERKI